MRDALGLRCQCERETKYRINRASDARQVFPFSWGDVAFQSASDLRGQYWDIFVGHQYAFTVDTEDPVIIDGGGNIGMSAIWFKRAYPGAKVKVYEPDPALLALIGRNLAAAHIGGVELLNSAIWVSDGWVSFDNQGGDEGSISLNGALRVPSIDLASHLPERVDLLKLDIEGAEYQVIDRLCKTGAISRIRNIVVEYHVRREDTDRFLSSIAQLRRAGMHVSMNAQMGRWLGPAAEPSSFETVGAQQILSEVYAWS